MGESESEQARKETISKDLWGSLFLGGGGSGKKECKVRFLADGRGFAENISTVGTVNVVVGISVSVGLFSQERKRIWFLFWWYRG